MSPDLSQFDPLPDIEKKRKPRPVSLKTMIRRAIEADRKRFRAVVSHPAFVDNQTAALFWIFSTNMTAQEITNGFLISVSERTDHDEEN